MSTSWAWQMSLLSFRLKSAVLLAAEAKAEKEAYWEFSFLCPTTNIQQSLENWVLNPMTCCMLSSLSFGERLWVGLVQSFSQTRRLSFELGQQTHGFSRAFIAYKLVGMHPSTKPNLYLTLLCHKHFHLKNLLFLDEEYLPTGLHDKRWNYVSQTKAAPLAWIMCQEKSFSWFYLRNWILFQVKNAVQKLRNIYQSMFWKKNWPPP